MNYSNDNCSERIYNSMSFIMKIFKSIIISVENAGKSIANYCYDESRLNKI